MSFATLDARNNTEARLFRREELAKKCNPPEFRTRTSDPEDEPEPGGIKCCDASVFSGAAEGRSNHEGSRADLAEAVEAPEELLRCLITRNVDAFPSPAELLNPTESHPCRKDTR
mmetsp:Transcript_30520/g.52950  ORF Transcript_30520/g.52950 Transcript_30520/m.52950 type:complete len:115 (+) Transcript_30520:371-715(+)